MSPSQFPAEVNIAGFKQLSEPSYILLNRLRRTQMSAFGLVNVLQVRVEDMGALATGERAMGVKRALNALHWMHCTPGEGLDISQMSTSGWKYVHKVQLQQISPHTARALLMHNKFLLRYMLCAGSFC